jgi:hypothetical protein
MHRASGTFGGSECIPGLMAPGSDCNSCTMPRRSSHRMADVCLLWRQATLSRLQGRDASTRLRDTGNAVAFRTSTQKVKRRSSSPVVHVAPEPRSDKVLISEPAQARCDGEAGLRAAVAKRAAGPGVHAAGRPPRSLSRREMTQEPHPPSLRHYRARRACGAACSRRFRVRQREAGVPSRASPRAHRRVARRRARS